MAKKGSPEWFRDPKIKVEEKQKFARFRSLSGPNREFWKWFYALQDDAWVIEEDGTVRRPRDDD